MASLSVDTAGGARTGALLLACVAEHGTRHPSLFRQRGAEARPRSDAATSPTRSISCARCTAAIPASSTMPPAAPSSPAPAPGSPRPPRRWPPSGATSPGSRSPPGRSRARPGGAGSETAILAQRAALATLAQSDRRGCALGAALAFAADWASIRTVLDAAAKRLGVDLAALPPRRPRRAARRRRQRRRGAGDRARPAVRRPAARAPAPRRSGTCSKPGSRRAGNIDGSDRGTHRRTLRWDPSRHPARSGTMTRLQLRLARFAWIRLWMTERIAPRPPATYAPRCASKAPPIMSRPTTSRSRSTPRSRCGGRCSSRASPAPARPSSPTRSPRRSARR